MKENGLFPALYYINKRIWKQVKNLVQLQTNN